MINRKYIIAILTGVSLLFFSGVKLTEGKGDMPHGWLKPEDEKTLLGRCTKCHTFHNALGASYTKDTNANICISCHKLGGDATRTHFSTSDQAGLVEMKGISHNWDSRMPSTDDPNNRFGLRSYKTVTNSTIQSRLDTIGLCSDWQAKGRCSNTAYTTFASCEANGGVWTPINNSRSKCESTTNRGTWTAHVTCSTCHNQHLQDSEPWNPAPEKGVAGIATNGTSSTITDSTMNWQVNQWAGTYIKVTKGSTSQRRKVLSNTADTITVTKPFEFTMIVGGVRTPVPVSSGDRYVIMKERKFMRVDNNKSQMCEACHYYMSPGAQTAGVRTWDGKKKSHPMGKGLGDVVNPDAYHPVPLDANLAAQSGAPRYHLNAQGDTNPTNNLVMDVDGKIRCLTCHGIHYTDSNTETEDKP